jgi:hypothetical protein
MKRLAEQAERGGTPLPAATLDAIRAAEEAEDLTAAADDAAGEPGAVYRADDPPHDDGCECLECQIDAEAVGYDCGEYGAGLSYRRGVFVRAHGQRFQSRRATDAEPGASDDWVVAPAPSAPPARASAKAKVKVPAGWQKLATWIIDAMRDWSLEQFAPVARVADLERKLLETKASGAGSGAELGDVLARLEVLERRLGNDAHEWAAASLADAYRGVFTDGQEYARGAVTTFGGSLWIAAERTRDRPGKSSAWRLAVKHGRDAREPR